VLVNSPYDRTHPQIPVFRTTLCPVCHWSQVPGRLHPSSTIFPPPFRTFLGRYHFPASTVGHFITLIPPHGSPRDGISTSIRPHGACCPAGCAPAPSASSPLRRGSPSLPVAAQVTPFPQLFTSVWSMVQRPNTGCRTETTRSQHGDCIFCKIVPDKVSVFSCSTQLNTSYTLDCSLAMDPATSCVLHPHPERLPAAHGPLGSVRLPPRPLLDDGRFAPNVNVACTDFFFPRPRAPPRKAVRGGGGCGTAMQMDRNQPPSFFPWLSAPPINLYELITARWSENAQSVF